MPPITHSPEFMKTTDLEKKKLADLEIDVIAVALVSTSSRTGEQNREHPQRHTHRSSLKVTNGSTHEILLIAR